MKYDVAILGAGLGGASTACILAANGISTVLIEAGAHPRFAIGESLVPETSIRLKLLAKRFGVPELGWLGTFHCLRDRVSPACGVKRSFAFAYHEPHRALSGEHCNELPTLTPPFGPDAHLFRQDTDQWLTTVAAKYGAEVRQQTRVETIDFEDTKAVLQTTSGDQITASFVVDATGGGSLLANKLGLRDATPRFQTQSRGMFTHMTGVQPFDNVGPDREAHGMPVPFSQSTLHHVFDGGWLWVIPFDNHRASTNNLCSVGLIRDARQPDPGLSPEDEFAEVCARFPSIARHFEGARAMRPWVKADRLQYSSSSMHGDRFCLLPHAAGFIDPLYSSGMSVTVGAIDLLSTRLIEAVRSNEYSAKQFDDVSEFVQGALDHYDIMVARSFDAWRSYDTWNAWNRVWALGNYLGTWGPLGLLAKYEQSQDPKYLEALQGPQHRGLLANQHSEFVEVRDTASTYIREAYEGIRPAHEAAGRIFEELDKLDFIPPYMDFSAPDRRAPTVFTLQTGARHILWYRWFGPEKWRDYCRMSLIDYLRLVFVFLFGQAATGLQRFGQALRDIFFTWNTDFEAASQSKLPTPTRTSHERQNYRPHPPAQAHSRSE